MTDSDSQLRTGSELLAELQPTSYGQNAAVMSILERYVNTPQIPSTFLHPLLSQQIPLERERLKTKRDHYKALYIQAQAHSENLLHKHIDTVSQLNVALAELARLQFLVRWVVALDSNELPERTLDDFGYSSN